jgi:diguanylate cyclase (GGDEF)-like protein
MAYFYEILLQDAGMEAHAVSDPFDVLEPLAAFDPDLILMDVNMPRCSGIELAAVLRQGRGHVQVPIIFLTADKTSASQLRAIEAGGDDYLTKPVDKRLLLASVRARAKRARLLTSLITSDSMTGLRNHSSIMEALATELSRARRQGTPMAFAMIDIDHFKAVNDTYGHWVGDTVIKSLSQILRQRLRRTDVIGRYGGEEFAVILPDANAEGAAQLIDRIREGFTKVRHMAGDEEFFVTFSCGIATFPQIDDAARLTTTADDALYKAKQGGRNRVVIAESCR